MAPKVLSKTLHTPGPWRAAGHMARSALVLLAGAAALTIAFYNLVSGRVF